MNLWRTLLVAFNLDTTKREVRKYQLEGFFRYILAVLKVILLD